MYCLSDITIENHLHDDPQQMTALQVFPSDAAAVDKQAKCLRMEEKGGRRYLAERVSGTMHCCIRYYRVVSLT